MKILWLCSWYPNKLDPFDGDFIERHAKAVSVFHALDVIHVVQNHFLLSNAKGEEECIRQGNIRFFLKIISLPKTGIALLDKIIFNRNYNKHVKKMLDDYVGENGKPDIVHVHVPVKIGAGVLYLKEKYNIPFVVTEHNSAYFDDIPQHYHQRSRYYRYITRKTLESAHAVSSVSDWLLKRLSDLFHVRSTRLIRNVVDESVFYYVPIQNKVKRFIHVSMMQSLKNVKGILSAFVELNKQYTSWELVLVGPYNESYRQMVKDGGIADKVFFTGLITYQEVAAQMRNADVLIHFSRYENLPCVINEALCCGLAIISSDVGGIKEVVTNDNGLMVASEDVLGLKDAVLQYAMHADRYNRKIISDQAIALYNYNTIGQELFEWYNDVLNHKNLNLQ